MAGVMAARGVISGTKGLSSLSRLEDVRLASPGKVVKALPPISGWPNKRKPNYNTLSPPTYVSPSCRDSPSSSSSSSSSTSSSSSSSSLCSSSSTNRLRQQQREVGCAAAAHPTSRQRDVGCAAVATAGENAAAMDAASSVATTDAATRVRLGSSDLLVPQLGIGSWAWGDRVAWNEGQWDDQKVKAVKQAFEAAMDAGIPLFDTAELYGRIMLGQEEAESLLGRFIKERKKKRAKLRPSQYSSANQIEKKEEEEEEEKVIIATKFTPFPWRVGREAVVMAAKRSLEQLGVERIDLYQLHWPGVWQNEAYWDGLADLVEAGLVRAVGVSNYNEKRMREAYAALSKRGISLASNQVHYNLLYRTPETSGVKAACDDLGVTLIAYSPIAQGMLTGKYSAETPPVSGFRAQNFPPEYLRKAAPLLARLKTLGEERGKTPTQVALNWLVAQGNVVPIPGAKTAEQAKEFAGALGWQMTPENVAELRQLAQQVPRYPPLPVERFDF